MRGKAVVHSVWFEKSISGYEYAAAEVVSHWKEGRNNIHAGGPVWTSRVTKKFKNGNFQTKNTHYIVVPAPIVEDFEDSIPEEDYLYCDYDDKEDWF